MSWIDKFIGKSVTIIKKDHPHFMEKGTIEGIEILNMLNRPAIKIKGEYNSFYVYEATDIQLDNI